MSENRVIASLGDKKIISEPSPANDKETSIKGLWKDVTLNEDDFLEAERAIFRDGIDKKW